MTDKQKRDELWKAHCQDGEGFKQTRPDYMYPGPFDNALTEYDTWHVEKIIEVIEREFPAQGDDIDSAILAIKDIIRTAGKEKPVIDSWEKACEMPLDPSDV